ncbi:LysR substrate-binding domain-containing protein [Halomonas sp. AOP12-C2-37]|uniref:LysR substrate-binding domain-containing protein n=1 Tax=unclassified Halomonas TaxID=2609666 RepID=UPI004033D784
MPTKITFRQVDAFRALMTSKTMTGAAYQMSITQPAVSRLISDLEVALGLQLFERYGPRIRPTNAAIRLIEEVDRVYFSLDYIQNVAQTIHRFPEDPIRIAAPPFLSYGFVARLISHLSSTYPGLVISLHTDSSRAVAEQVSRGQHDIGFCTLVSAEHNLRVLYRSSVNAVCVLPARHPLARLRSIHVNDLAQERLVVLGPSGTIRPQINNVFKSAGISPLIAAEVMLSASALGFVAEGLGIALMDPFSAVASRDERIRIRPFTPVVGMDFTAITPRQGVHPRIMSSIAQILELAMKDEVANWAQDLRGPFDL